MRARPQSARGYEVALLNTGGGTQTFNLAVRNGDRCIVDSPHFADALFARLRHALPATFAGRGLVGLNERLRFLRYDRGGYFRPHRDGPYDRPASSPLAGEGTLITVLVYLNSDYEGCETTFYEDAGLEGLGLPAEGLAVAPLPGLALVHDHNLLHSAPTLVRGRKYVLRADVLYK